MKIVKLVWGLILVGALVVVVQLADPPQDSPTVKFQRLPDVSLRGIVEAEWAAGRTEAALLLLDYIVENDLPEKDGAVAARQKIFAQLGAENSPVFRLKATGWAAALAGGNAFDSLAGNTVADAVLYGEIADVARRGGLDGYQDDFTTALNNIQGMTNVFPPADAAITLAKAARRAGAINESLTQQLRQALGLMQADPKSALAVEKFKENFMPMFELAKRCRTWGEFETILQQADSPDQLAVLTKMASTSPATAKRLSQVLSIAVYDGRPTVSACLDYILHQGPRGLDPLYAAVIKGPAGLKLVAANPGLRPQNLHGAARARHPLLDSVQDRYQSLRYEYGPVVSALKYLIIAILCGLLVLVVIPGRYLEKLIARPGGPVAAPGAIHYLMSALAVGVVLAGLAYLLSLAMHHDIQPPGAGTVASDASAPMVGQSVDSAFLSGTVVLVSLAIHAVVWFFVRGKIRLVEDDESESPALRLKRLENLEVFLDLPLFTGLGLTVIAFILITLDAGMSRHFAYTSTVVGILSAVSLRIRYVYPLKERLIQVK
jgi:hypothetical protein